MMAQRALVACAVLLYAGVGAQINSGVRKCVENSDARKGKTCINDAAPFIQVSNSGFEADASLVQNNKKQGQAVYLRNDEYPDIPKGWTTEGRIRLTKNLIGKTPWGGGQGVDSCDKDYFVILSRADASIKQTLTGLSTTKHYELSFLSAERVGYDTLELLSVVINGQTLLRDVNPSVHWETFRVQFMANSGGTAEIKFINTSPIATGPSQGSPTGDHHVFLDKVQVAEVRDCGGGASCHDSSRFGLGFMCRCDVKGFVGHDATNSKAACAKSDAKDPIVALTETVKVLTERIAALTDTNARLEATVKGIQDNVADVGAATIKLSEQKAVVDGLVLNVQSLLNTQKALKQTLTGSGQVTGPVASSGSPNGPPTLVADSDGINVELGKGQTFRLNGDDFATVQSVNDALAEIAGQL